jgi:hypothetical protein
MLIGAGEMSEYSAYLITETGIIARVQSVYSDDDEGALRIARQLLVEARFASIEVWDHLHRIGAIDLE